MGKGPPPVPPHLQKPQKRRAAPNGELKGFFSPPPVPPPIPSTAKRRGMALPPPVPSNAKKKQVLPLPPPQQEKGQIPFAGEDAKPEPENIMGLPKPQEPEPQTATPKTPAKAMPKKPTRVFVAEPDSPFADVNLEPDKLNAFRLSLPFEEIPRAPKGPSPPVETPAPATRSSMPSGIDITHSLEGPAPAKISIDRELVHLNGESLFQKVADACIRLQPSLEQEEIRFEMDGIFVGNKKIGDFSGGPSRIKIEISMDSLGYSMDCLPLGAISAEFNVSAIAPSIAIAISESSSVALLAMRFGKRDLIKLGFFNKDRLLEQTALLKQQ